MIRTRSLALGIQHPAEEEANAGALYAAFAIPTENTHGFEMVLHHGGIVACAATLTEYLIHPSG